MARRTLLVCLSLMAGTAHAALLETDRGLLPPDDIRVAVDIRSQVATTAVEYVFDVSGTGGGRFLFPTPESASVTGFAHRVGADWVDATLSREDPRTADDVAGDLGGETFLRNYLGGNAFVVRVPPSPADQVRVRLEYIEILPYDFGEVTYAFPLAGYDRASARPDYQIVLDLHTERRLLAAGAPGYGDAERVLEETRTRRKVRYDGEAGGRDFEFVYSVEQQDLFTHLLTHHESCDEDGFFLLVVEPRQDVDSSEIVPKYFTFVLDTSGSMDGRKLAQAKEAASFFVEHLNDQDRFNVVRFDSWAESLFRSPEEVSRQTTSAALRFVRDLYASGGTNLDAALQSAFSARIERGFARIVVLLTDGQPTAGVTDPERILANMRRANTADARLFTFGVGADVNADLLRALAADHRGETRLLDEGGEIGGLLADFFLRINRPVMTDVSLDLGSVDVYDHHPEETTDLFAGTQLFVVGRYRRGGATTAALTGLVAGEDARYTFPVDFPACARGANGFLPRLWAKARIETLLDRIAREGEDPRLVAEIEALALRYGIQTRYTSFGVERPKPGRAPAQPSAPSGGRSPAGSSSGGGSGGSSGGSRRSPGRYASGALDDETRGCSATPGRGAAWFALFGLLAVRRRRE